MKLYSNGVLRLLRSRHKAEFLRPNLTTMPNVAESLAEPYVLKFELPENHLLSKI